MFIFYNSLLCTVNENIRSCEHVQCEKNILIIIRYIVMRQQVQYNGWKCYCYNYSVINYRITLNVRLFFHTIFVFKLCESFISRFKNLTSIDRNLKI